MKITPKPIVNSDKINKARDMSGLREWSRESRIVGFFMSILGWFTIPAEVFLRRRFGRRWFTPMNFYAGAFLLFAFAALQYSIDKIHYWFRTIESTFNPFYSKDATENFAASADLFLLLYIYVALGMLHLLKIWWRNRTNEEIHSYDDGTSWLEDIAIPLVVVLNAIAWLVIDIIRDPLGSDSKKDMVHPKWITDRTAFTNTILEPLLFFWIAYDYPYVLGKCLFYIMAFAVAIHASRRETAKKSKILDFKDSQIEAKVMRELRSNQQAANTPGTGKQQKPADKEQKPKMQEVPVNYPDLMSIIEEMHREKHHLAN